jgi:hypothetical protein
LREIRQIRRLKKRVRTDHMLPAKPQCCLGSTLIM